MWICKKCTNEFTIIKANIDPSKCPWCEGEIILKSSLKPKFVTKIIYNEGYGKQCMSFNPFEADSMDEAKKISEVQISEFLVEKSNADILDVKVSLEK